MRTAAKKSIAVLLAASLLATAPGLGGYHAAAAITGAGRGAAVKVRAIALPGSAGRAPLASGNPLSSMSLVPTLKPGAISAGVRISASAAPPALAAAPETVAASRAVSLQLGAATPALPVSPAAVPSGAGRGRDIAAEEALPAADDAPGTARAPKAASLVSGAAKAARRHSENGRLKQIARGKNLFSNLFGLYSGSLKNSDAEPAEDSSFAAGPKENVGESPATASVPGGAASRPGLERPGSASDGGGRGRSEPPAARSPEGGGPEGPSPKEVDAILRGYVIQQMFLRASFAFYSALFTPVAKVLAGPFGLLWGRLGYAGALMLVSPFAGVAVERMSVRSIQKYGFLARALIWTALVPGAWLLIGGGWPFVAAFVGLMLLDGTVVSGMALTDLDAGGLDLLSKQYGFAYDKDRQVRLNALNDAAASFGRMVLAPLMAVLGLMFAAGVASASGGLVLAMAISFGVPALLGTFFLTRHLPDRTVGKAEIKRVTLKDVLSGWQIVREKRKVRNRLGMNAVEKGLEDLMGFVLFAEFGILVMAPALGPALAGIELGGPAGWLIGLVQKVLAVGTPAALAAVGALMGALLLAAGKAGALITSLLMPKFWRAPGEDAPAYKAYKVFFPLTLLGALATLLFPVALELIAGGSFWLGAGVAAAGAFLFNLFFTAPVQGWRQLMQRILREEGASGRLFGINGTIIMAVSFMMLGLTTVLFSTVTAGALGTAMWGTAGAIALYGVVQQFRGPHWLFSDEERAGLTPSEARPLEELGAALASSGMKPYRRETALQDQPAARPVVDLSPASAESLARLSQAPRGSLLALDGSWLEELGGDGLLNGYLVKRGVYLDESGEAVVADFSPPRKIAALKRSGRDPPAEVRKVGPAWVIRDQHPDWWGDEAPESGAYAPRYPEKAVIVVGGNHFGRPHLLTEPQRVAKSLGLRMILVDLPANQPDPSVFPPEDFVAAPINGHKPEDYAATVAAVKKHLEGKPVSVVGATAFFHSFVEHSAVIVDALREEHNPKLRGSGHEAIKTAQTKALARERLMAIAPEVSVRFRRVDSEEEARAAFRELTHGKRRGKVVLKGIMGAAKAGLRKDIVSEDHAAAAYEEVRKELMAFTEGELGRVLSLDVFPGIMMEEQVSGPEVDVEIVRDRMGGVALVIGNPSPIEGRVERGMSFPAQLDADPEKAQRKEKALVEGALAALDAIGAEHGNFHVEMILDQGKRPVIVEINPRMVGANGFFFVAEMYPGYNLIEQGLRAVAGLPAIPPGTQKYAALVSRKMLPKPGHGGRIESIRGAAAAGKMPGIVSFKLTKQEGGSIMSLEDGFGDDIYGYVLASGKDYAEAKANALAAMGSVELTVEKPVGVSVIQRGNWGHEPDDE